MKISIHAPRAGSDDRLKRRLGADRLFQSTLPVRGATCLADEFDMSVQFQSTLPVRGATGEWISNDLGGYISIHAPRAGSDVLDYYPLVDENGFQSTLPVRGATPVTGD